MKALVYHGPGQRGWDTVDDPASTNALKVVLQGSERGPGSNGRIGASAVAGAA